MSQVSEIVTLQSIDDEAAALRAAFEDVERRLHGSERLNAARRDFATADSALQAAQKDQRLLEGQIEGLTAKIVPEERRLYDGSVRNPKELGSIQSEVENLKRHRSEYEDALLEVLARVEVAERQRKEALAAVTTEESAWEQERGELTHEAGRLRDAINRADLKRELQKVKVNARALHTYDEVRRRRGGAAVAQIKGGACGACRIAIPDAVRKHAFAPETLVQCPNCDRILYIG